MRRLIPAVAVFSFIATSCGGPDLVERRGSIMDRDGVVVLELPAEFQVNQPGTVAVTTFGNSCISFARTQVTVQGLIATVEPYDFDDRLRQDLTGLVVCNDNRMLVRHPAELVFATTGEAAIQFTGLHEWVDSVGQHDSVITVERRVPVR